MKITIELTEAQLRGIKDYLLETEGKAKPSKHDIEKEVRGIIDTYFQSNNALNFHIAKYEK